MNPTRLRSILFRLFERRYGRRPNRAEYDCLIITRIETVHPSDRSNFGGIFLLTWSDLNSTWSETVRCTDTRIEEVN